MYLNTTIFAPCTCPSGLTLTWDVFKLKSFIASFGIVKRLTLTWDVFKSIQQDYKNYLAMV